MKKKKLKFIASSFLFNLEGTIKRYIVKFTGTHGNLKAEVYTDDDVLLKTVHTEFGHANKTAAHRILQNCLNEKF